MNTTMIRLFLSVVLPVATVWHATSLSSPSVRLRPSHIISSSAPTTTTTPFDFRNRRRRNQITTRLLLSTSNNDENDEDPNNNGENGVDGLYEFLTRRTGEQAGETERKRKRDRIKGWMSGSSSSGSRSKNTEMVKPIRLEDGSSVESRDATEPMSTTPKLNQLFDGMPTLGEILTRDGETGGDTPATIAQSTGSAAAPETKRGKKDKPEDMENDGWFEEERQQLVKDYEQILQDAKSKLELQRQTDGPDSVPANAERIVESVIFQERNRMIASVKIERAKERLQEYEIDRMTNLEEGGSALNNDDSDEIAKRILQEAADDWNRRQEIQSRVDEFDRYQAEAFLKNSGSDNNSSGSATVPTPPVEGTNMDQWALERLESMLEDAKDQSEDVTDILEQNIDDLKDEIEKESKKGSIRPETMKEWQMYRSIATRLGENGGPDGNSDVENEERISNQLNSWREYTGKEEDIRNRSGLSVGPRMPFDWNKPGKDPREDPIPTSASSSINTEGKTRREIRRDVNIQAVKAMEELIAKSDSVRSENLKTQLDALKSELESRDYNDIEEEIILEETKPEPVDLSDIFSRGEEEGEDKTTLPSPGFTEYEKYNIDKMLSSDGGGSPDASYTSPPPLSQPPPIPDPNYYDDVNDIPQEKPNTPFFADDNDKATKIAPPDSPFFSNDVGRDEKTSDGEVDIVNTKLGSGEEQKLRAMYRRAGAVTKEQQDKIREEWEAFQSFEKSRRDESGLSDGDDSVLVDKADLKYDLSEVMKDDGDIDAAKILASLGPRPTRKKKSGGEASSSADLPAASSNAIEKAEVADSLFRSVEAVGGGTTKDDPVARERERNEFEEYLQKEQKMRESLDNREDDAASIAMGSVESIPLDDEDYVEEVLDSIGPRPMFKRKVKQAPDSRRDVESDNASREEDTASGDADDGGMVPNWLKKERKAAKSKSDDDSIGLLGGNMNEVFDDDKYEQNIRQLHEYEQRRSGKNQQMGIDISDVLGRRGSDDYADYTYDADYLRGRQNNGWGAVSFEARKNALLDYIELSTVELNNLLDHRDSVYTTGASQYLPRINKPFKEFGAIFRLEGVLVDLTGLHNEVWTAVASKHELTAPMLEDVKRAAVVRPELAIRDIFYWTNDFQLANKIISSFREIFRHKFDEWASDNGFVAEPPKPVETQGSMAMGAEVVSQVLVSPPPANTMPLTEASRLKQIQERWSIVAQSRGYPTPTNEQIAQCSFLTPDIAVRNVLCWSNDPVEIDSIVKQFEAPSNSETNTPQEAETAGGSAAAPDANAILELQYKAWIMVASDNGLEAPEPEEVLAASVLNDPEAVVMHGYGWTDETDQASALGKQYRDYFAALVQDVQQPGARTTDSVTSPVEVTDVSPQQSNGATERKGPTEEEVLSMQIEAWKTTASTHSFKPPASDEIELTINLSAADAVRRLLGWKYNFNGEQITEITSTYEQALKESSKKYLDLYNIPVETVNQPATAKTDESDGITADMLYQAAFDAWTTLAWKDGRTLPDQDQVQFAFTVGPEEAVVNGFEWTDDYTEAAAIAQQYRDQLKGKRDAWKKAGYMTSSSVEAHNVVEEKMPLVSIVNGVSEWIGSLEEVEMGCGVASYLERDQMDILIKFANLDDLLPADKRVSLNNGYDRESQQMLGVALRIERRPDHCVIFDSSPYANSAGQEVDMRSVSMVGPYPRYELLSADTSAFSLDELTALNIRRLFGERVYDQPMLDMKQNQPEVVRKTMTKYWDPED